MIPYEKKAGPPSVEDLQILTKSESKVIIETQMCYIIIIIWRVFAFIYEINNNLHSMITIKTCVNFISWTSTNPDKMTFCKIILC